MSGYSPSVLELTSPQLLAPLTRLQGFLEQTFALVQPRDVSRRYGGTRIVGNVSIGETRVGIEAGLRRSGTTSGDECLAIELESSAYDAAYDLMIGKAFPKGRKALIRFCVDVASEMNATGFRLRRDENHWPTLSSDVLQSAIKPVGEIGIMVGVAQSSELARDMKRYWSRTLEEVEGYLLLVAI